MRWVAAVVGVTALLVSDLTSGGLGDLGGLDTDADGLPNTVEISGWRTQDSGVFVTDPNDTDSDGDGLSDGEEAGALIADAQSGTSYIGHSSPRLPDTDGDGIGDADEYFLDMDAQSKDSDSDGLLDDLELEFDSDPTLDNPDDDSYSDKEEYDRGSDPLVYTLTRSQSAAAVAAGGTFGDCDSCARKAGLRDEQIQSVEYLSGHLASGAAGYGDVRDLGVGLIKLDFRTAGMSAVGLVPYVGGTIKTVSTMKRFAKLGNRPHEPSGTSSSACR